MSLYTQLSRAERWEGLHLFRKLARSNFIKPNNVLDRAIREVVLKLERLGDETRQYFERDHKHERWFQDWNAISESMLATTVTDEEDTPSGARTCNRQGPKKAQAYQPKGSWPAKEKLGTIIVD